MTNEKNHDTDVSIVKNCEQLAKDNEIRYGVLSFKIQDYKVVNIRKESNIQIR